jgi:predicted permease
MRWTSRLAIRLRSLFKRTHVERELDAELQFHLAQQVEENLAAGMNMEEARSSALRSLGALAYVKEACRESLGLRLVDELRQDVRYAVRTLVKNPAFTLIAVSTLALGIGANTAVFSVVNAVLLRPLPFKDSDRLVRVLEIRAPREGVSRQPIETIDGAELGALQSRAQTLSAIGMYSGMPMSMTLTGRDESVRLAGERLSSAIFSVLGTTPLLGRTFEPREETFGADAVVVLSYATWQRRFGGDPDILGQIVALDGRRYSVVGVLAPDFQFPNPLTEFWIPLVVPTDGPAARQRFRHVARLKDTSSIATATAEVSTIMRGLRTTDSTSSRFEIVRVQDQLVAPVKPALLVLTVAVSVVLLIACVNVANLLLARTAARQREIAVRLALGASRVRLLRQLLTESLMLALAGGTASMGMALGGVRILRTLGTALPRRDLYLGSGVSIPRLDEVGVDLRVLAFTMGVSIVAALLFGLAPAIRQSRSEHGNALREGIGSARGGFNLFGRGRMPSWLVVAEIAMAVTLLVGGGLLIRSFAKLSHVDPGYDPINLAWFQVFPPRERSTGVALTTFSQTVVERLQSVPSVRSASYAVQLPTGNLLRETSARTTPDPPRSSDPPRGADVRIVSQDFIRTMGIRVIAGRGFEESDHADAPRVILINQALARSGVIGESPLGTRIYAIGREPWEIVGIVEDVHQFGLDRAPASQVFIDFRQQPGLSSNGLYVAVRTDRPIALMASLRAIVRQLDPSATVDSVGTMEQLLSNSISRPRLYAMLLGIFAGIALLLAAIGIYGVIAYGVARRSRELGIRIALGAQGVHVIGLVLRQGMALTILGLVFGMAGAAAVTRYLEGMLFGLTPLDSSTFVTVAVLFAMVATLAGFVPARRATKVDPMVVLRSE